ncbi:hypothetical protein SAMN04488144_15511 [Methylobacterium sp. 190mf]|uniref:hypothetical protein n=1 Tax=Methylobacterium sp. 190mf TaxID=1761798 RepID=UPI00089F0A58|nr:hypothetical protein [Methylobacterium sp. 190mf]SEG72005.1 hypothetical protein SAMN04488144_15511 [Methylobacterium sp. 190mf]
MKIFWSWQSDIAQRICREFVRSALTTTLPRLMAELDLEESERPELDHDTLGEPGLVDIAATIFRKIEEASVFVADVTSIATTGQGKKVANPNVLIELGYALKALGPERIVLVANERYGGGPADLPFDLRNRRGPITYRLDRNADETAMEAAQGPLVEDLVAALSATLSVARTTRDAVLQPVVQPSRPGDPSVWFPAGTMLQARDWFGRAGVQRVVLPEAPRSYMRIIPAGWGDPQPAALDLHNLGDEARLRPLGRWLTGDGGLNADGVLYFEPTEGTAPCETQTITQWFVDSGEIWGVDNKAARSIGGQILFDINYTTQRWAIFLRSGLEALRRVGALGPILVEAGVVGLTTTRWYAVSPSARVEGLRDQARATHSTRDWDEAAQIAFILDAVNHVRSAFGVHRASFEEVAPQIEAGWQGL